MRAAAGGAKQDTPGPSRSLSCPSLDSQSAEWDFSAIYRNSGGGGKKGRLYVEICFEERAGFNNSAFSSPSVKPLFERGTLPPEPPAISRVRLFVLDALPVLLLCSTGRLFEKFSVRSALRT